MLEETQHPPELHPKKGTQYSEGFQRLMENAMRNMSRVKNAKCSVVEKRSCKNNSQNYYKKHLKHKTLEREESHEIVMACPMLPSISRTNVIIKRETLANKIPHSTSFQNNIKVNSHRRDFSINSYFEQCASWSTEEKQKIVHELKLNKNKYKLSSVIENLKKKKKSRNKSLLDSPVLGTRRPKFLNKNYEESIIEDQSLLREYAMNEKSLFTSNFSPHTLKKTKKTHQNTEIFINSRWDLEPWQTRDDAPILSTRQNIQHTQHTIVRLNSQN